MVRSFAEFLLLPSLVVIAFFVLAATTDLCDRSDWSWVRAVRALLHDHVFRKPSSTSAVLTAVASGIITMTSITISVLLVALQQSSTNLTPQVFDQFLRRRQNQVFFGYFVGLAIYALLVLASVDAPFNPILGAAMTLMLAVLALLMLLVMLYSIITQMRPVEIITAIHDHILHARQKQQPLLRRTRRHARIEGPSRPIRAATNGFVTGFDLGSLRRVAGDSGEVTLVVAIGAYVAVEDLLATVRGTPRDVESTCEAVRSAVHIERRRDITTDPAYGIEQLQTIGWSAISSAKQNQEAGLLCIRELRDVLARWAVDGGIDEHDDPCLAVVYADDVPDELFDAFEALAIVTSESLQTPCFAEIVESLALVFPRLSLALRLRAEDVARRILAAMGDHVMTRALAQALDRLRNTLRDSGFCDTARAVEDARAALDLSVATLASRATRVPPRGSAPTPSVREED